MKIEETNISGLKLIHLNKISDLRGSFIKIFNKDFFEQNHLEFDYKESYYSISSKNVIRGMHFQIPPFEHTKLVYVNQGCILDVVLDLRRDSKTFGSYFSYNIGINNPVVVYIPVGCAHGFLSLENNTMVTYLQTSVYSKDCDMGVRYNSFGMDWGISDPIVSGRDLDFICFLDYNSMF